MQLRDNPIPTPVSPPPPPPQKVAQNEAAPAGPLLALTVIALAALFSSGSALAQTPTVDYDLDDDGLIEVSNLAQLNAIRWDLDGNGRSSNDVAFVPAYPNRGANDDGDPTMGCPNHTCIGYELTTNLDFDTNRNGVPELGDLYSNGGAGWEPIRGFTATFDGGYHTISNLFINRAEGQTGLFGRIEAGSVIRNVGLPNVDITVAGDRVGALVGLVEGGGLIEKCFATGKVTTVPRNVHRYYAGGLVGDLTGTVQASWTDVDVRSGGRIGGLVGQMEDNANAAIIASYSLGDVISTGEGSDLYPKGRHLEAGGLYGSVHNNVVSNSYFDNSIVVLFHYSEFDGPHSTRTAGYGATARSTAQMQNPVGYTGIYTNWNLDLDGDGTVDDPWDFGTASQYPALKGDSNKDGVFTWEEFGHQGRVDLPDVIVTSAQAAVTEGQTVRFTVTIDSAPAQALTIDVQVQAKGDYGVDNAAATVTIPANRKSVAYTVNTVGDAEDERNGWVQLSALTALPNGEAYDLPVPSSRVNVNDNDAPASVAGVYTPRLPQVTGSLADNRTLNSQRVPRPGSFSLHVRPDTSRQARADQAEFGETQAYQDWHASLKYKWEQISGPPLGPPLRGGCEKNLPGHPWGHSTYCTYSLYSPEQVMSWNVWDGVTEPSALYPYRINGANPPGDYVFRLMVRDQFNDDTYTAPQTITVTVADETGGASAPRAVGRVSTRSLHPQGSSYTVNEVGKGPDGVYGGGDDTRQGGDPGPDEIKGTDDDNVLIVGPDGLPCTDDDTLACGMDGRPGTDDDELNLGPDSRAGTADDNTYVVEPPGNALQSPDRPVTLSGSSSRAARGRSIRSYAWQQICMNPDAEGDHKLIALDLLLRGQGYCGVDVTLSRATGSTTTFTTPLLPAAVRRVSAEITTAGTVTTTPEDSVNLFFMLTVTDSAGNQDYDIVKVEVEPLPQWVVDENGRLLPDYSPIPKATASYPGSNDRYPGTTARKPALEGVTVTLDGSGSRATRGSISSYQWKQLSGPAVELTNADQRRATFTTPTGQTTDMAYSFLLTVENSVGWSNSDVVRIGVRARPTVAVDFTSPRNAQTKTDWEAGEVIGLRGDIGGVAGETLTYTWKANEGPLEQNNNIELTEDLTSTLEGPGGRVPNGFTVPCLEAPTRYTFALKVSDGVSSDGTHIRPDPIGLRILTVNKNAETGACTSPGEPPVQPPFEVVETAPTADAGPDLAGQPGDSVTLQGTNSDNPYGKWWEMAHQWVQLSGPTVTLTHPLTTQPASNFGDPSFIVPEDAADGTALEFRLTVTDKEGVSDSDTMTVTVDAPAPATGQSQQLPAGPRITIERTGISSIVSEGGTAGFEIIPGDVVEDDITVTLEITVEGDFGVSAGQQTVLVKAREGELDIEFATHDDDMGEANGTLTVRVVSGDGYRVGSPSAATFTITDNDGGVPMTGVSLDNIALEFEPDRTEYLVQVANEVTQTAVQTTNRATLQITAKGASVEVGEVIPLEEGGNVINISQNSGGTAGAIYTVTITRAAAPPEEQDAEPSSNRWTITLSPASGIRPADGQTPIDVLVTVQCNEAKLMTEQKCPFAPDSVTFQIQADGSEAGEATHRTDFGGPRKPFTIEREPPNYTVRLNLRPGSGDAEYIPFVLLENGVAMAEARFRITP